MWTRATLPCTARNSLWASQNPDVGRTRPAGCMLPVAGPVYCIFTSLLYVMQIVNDDIEQLVESQSHLEASFEKALGLKQARGPTTFDQNEMHTTTSALRNNAAIFAWSLKQNPLATDNMEKIQEDR